MQYKWRNGLRVNPIIGFNVGYPYGAGLLTAAQINGRAVNVPNTNVTNQAATRRFRRGDAIRRSGKPGLGVQAQCRRIARHAGEQCGRRHADELAHQPREPQRRVQQARHPQHPGSAGDERLQQHLRYPDPQPRYQPVATGISGPRTGTTSQRPLRSVRRSVTKTIRRFATARCRISKRRTVTPRNTVSTTRSRSKDASCINAPSYLRRWEDSSSSQPAPLETQHSSHLAPSRP